MKYVIATVDWMLDRGIVVPEHARMSLNGSKVIFHYGFIEPILTQDNNDGATVYEHDSEELRELLSGAEWTAAEIEV